MATKEPTKKQLEKAVAPAKIDKKAIEKEPWLKAFTRNVNSDYYPDKDEEKEINDIRKRLASPLLRCRAKKAKEGKWNVGDEIGVREFEFAEVAEYLEIIK